MEETEHQIFWQRENSCSSNKPELAGLKEQENMHLNKWDPAYTIYGGC